MSALSKLLTGAVVLASVSFSVQAQAAAYVSSFGLTQLGSVGLTPTGTTLIGATSITFATTTLGGFGANGPAYQSGAAYTVNAGGTVPTPTLNGAAPAYSSSWVANGVTFTFNATSGVYSENTVNGGSGGASTTDTFNFSYFGTITNTSTGASSTGLLDPQTAILAITITQAGPGGSVTQAASFTTPAPAPEPVSMVLLGTGLVGLLAARRRV